MEDMETTTTEEHLMRVQKEMDKIRLIKGLKENIEICNEMIKDYTDKKTNWEEIKRQTITELQQINTNSNTISQ